MRSHRIEANGLTLRVLEWCPPTEHAASAPPVVLVHGWMDAAGTWDLVAERLLAAGHRVLAPDMRGFGESDRAPRSAYYHFPDYIADLAELLHHLVPDGSPVVLVGHSMGGTIATLYASARPARIARLVLIEGIGPPDHTFEAGAARLATWLDDLESPRLHAARFTTRALLLRRLSASHPTIPVERLETRLPHLIVHSLDAAPDADAYVWNADPRHRTTAPTPFFAALYKAHAARVRAPVLSISGGPTGFHPDDERDRLAAFEHHREETFPTAGHMIHWTHPDELAASVLCFLATTPPRATTP